MRAGRYEAVMREVPNLQITLLINPLFTLSWPSLTSVRTECARAPSVNVVLTSLILSPLIIDLQQVMLRYKVRKLTASQGNGIRH